ncbi:uroplakin-2 [Clarias gariepinus]
MLAVLLIAGALIPLTHAQDFPLALLSTESQMISSRFFNSLLLTLPPCNYAGKNVDLEYQNLDINTKYYISNIFTIPSCINTGYPNGLSAFSRRIGYQLMNLNESTQYRIIYKIGNLSSTPLTASTRTAVNYTDIDLSFAGRSAAMVVITVVLSVTMFILLLGIIISLFVSPKKD